MQRTVLSPVSNAQSILGTCMWELECSSAHLNLKVLQPLLHSFHVLDSKGMMVSTPDVPGLRLINIIDFLLKATLLIS